MADPTRELVSKAKDGSTEAVEELLERYLPGLRAFVRRRAGARVRAREAESDIVQSACRQVLQGLGSFRYEGDDAFVRWLHATALRKILNKDERYRALKRDAAMEVARPASLEDLCRSLSTPSQHAMAREQEALIAAALARLSEDQRRVVFLAKVEGRSRAEIAAEMGRSEVAVRILLHRALARLSALLEPSGG